MCMLEQMATHAKAGHSKKVRKQFLLDPEKLRLAKEYFHAKTDTEAVEKALDLASGNKRMADAHRQLFEADSGFLDVFGRLGPIEG